MRTMTRTSLFLPLFSTALGVACFVAFWIGGERGRPGSRWRCRRRSRVPQSVSAST